MNEERFAGDGVGHGGVVHVVVTDIRNLGVDGRQEGGKSRELDKKS